MTLSVFRAMRIPGLLLFCVVAAFSSGFLQAAERPANGQTTEDARRVFEEAKTRVYQIRSLTIDGDAENSSGSGFLVGETGLIATNWHVVSGNVLEPGTYRLEALTTDKVRVPVRIVAVDSMNDLALLQAEGVTGVPLPLRRTALEKGEKGFAIGNPRGVGFTVVEGNFNGVVSQAISGYFHFTAPMNAGMSGGPALTRDGEVFGVNVAKRTDSDSMGFLVPADRLAALIARPRSEKPDNDTLLEEARQGMIAGQNRVAESVLRPNPETRQIGQFRFPTGQDSTSRCRGSTLKEEDDGYAVESASCLTDLSIEAGRRHGVSLFWADYSVVRNLSLDGFRFAARLSDLATKEKDDKGYRKVVGRYDCRTSHVRLHGGTARVTLCTRPYLKLEGLKDAHMRVVTIDSSEQALVGDLLLRGFTDANIKRLSRWYLETIEWKR